MRVPCVSTFGCQATAAQARSFAEQVQGSREAHCQELRNAVARAEQEATAAARADAAKELQAALAAQRAELEAATAQEVQRVKQAMAAAAARTPTAGTPKRRRLTQFTNSDLRGSAQAVRSAAAAAEALGMRRSSYESATRYRSSSSSGSSGSDSTGSSPSPHSTGSAASRDAAHAVPLSPAHANPPRYARRPVPPGVARTRPAALRWWRTHRVVPPGVARSSPRSKLDKMLQFAGSYKKAMMSSASGTPVSQVCGRASAQVWCPVLLCTPVLTQLCVCVGVRVAQRGSDGRDENLAPGSAARRPRTTSRADSDANPSVGNPASATTAASGATAGALHSPPPVAPSSRSLHARARFLMNQFSPQRTRRQRNVPKRYTPSRP